MNAKSFPEANRIFSHPNSMSEEECGSLEVHDTGEAFISFWEPTPAERAQVSAGAPVWLWIWGRGHPPVSLSAEHPFRPIEEARPTLDLQDLLREPLDQLAGAASMCWEPKPGEQVFDADAALAASREAAAKIAALVQVHDQEMAREANLGRELVQLLQEHAGETGESEGAVDVLQRILDENAAARRRAACDHPRTKTLLEDGRTDCMDCGLSLRPLFWTAEHQLVKQGAVKIVMRPDATPVRRPLDEVGKATHTVAVDKDAIEWRARAAAEKEEAEKFAKQPSLEKPRHNLSEFEERFPRVSVDDVLGVLIRAGIITGAGGGPSREPAKTMDAQGLGVAPGDLGQGCLTAADVQRRVEDSKGADGERKPSVPKAEAPWPDDEDLLT